MAVTADKIKEQLPPGAQISGDSREIAGVIDDRIQGDGDMLLNQAMMMARARKGVAYEGGGEFSGEFLERVKRNNLPRQYVNQRLSEETINSLTQSSITRTGQPGELYEGNNTEWTGYYLN